MPDALVCTRLNQLTNKSGSSCVSYTEWVFILTVNKILHYNRNLTTNKSNPKALFSNCKRALVSCVFQLLLLASLAV
jgi:hypothetical protein